MKRLAIFIAICAASSTLCAVSPSLADDAEDMRKACPVAQFETWDKARNRAACESKFIERRADMRANPEKYMDEAIRKAERAERAAQDAENAARRAEDAAQFNRRY